MTGGAAGLGLPCGQAIALPASLTETIHILLTAMLTIMLTKDHP